MSNNQSSKRLRPNARLYYEAADEWYDTLGYHVTSDDGRYHTLHPICDIDEVDTFEPKGRAEEALLEYAKDAADAAYAVEEALKNAVEAYRNGDLNAVEEALDEASTLESEYGDDAASRSLRERLIEEIQ